jgi:hypothetical protein
MTDPRTKISSISLRDAPYTVSHCLVKATYGSPCQQSGWTIAKFLISTFPSKSTFPYLNFLPCAVSRVVQVAAATIHSIASFSNPPENSASNHMKHHVENLVTKGRIAGVTNH